LELVHVTLHRLPFLQELRHRRHRRRQLSSRRELKVSERTIYRDKPNCRQGAPIQGESGVGYILKPGLPAAVMLK